MFEAIVRCAWEYVVRNPKLFNVSQPLEVFSSICARPSDLVGRIRIERTHVSMKEQIHGENNTFHQG